MTKAINRLCMVAILCASTAITPPALAQQTNCERMVEAFCSTHSNGGGPGTYTSYYECVTTETAAQCNDPGGTAPGGNPNLPPGTPIHHCSGRLDCDSNSN